MFCKVWHIFQSIQFKLYLFSESELTHKGDGISSMLSKIYLFSKETKTGIEKILSIPQPRALQPPQSNLIKSTKDTVKRILFLQKIVLQCSHHKTECEISIVFSLNKAISQTKMLYIWTKSSLPWHKAFPLVCLSLSGFNTHTRKLLK